MNKPVKDITAIMRMDNPRLRNFILCTPNHDEETLGIIQRGAPELFTDRAENNHPVPLKALLISTFRRVPARKELTNAVDMFAACEEYKIPIVRVFISCMYDDFDAGDADEPYIPIDIDRELYHLGCCEELSEKRREAFANKAVGDHIRLGDDLYVIVGIGHAMSFVALAPKALIEIV